MQPDIYKREVLNSTIEIAAAKARTKRYPLLEKDNVVLQILWTVPENGFCTVQGVYW